MTRPRLILAIRCAVLAGALWLGAEGIWLAPVALMMPPSILGPAPATCAIYSTGFSTDPFASGDLVALSGTFTTSGGEVSTTSATPLAVTVAESTTGHGVASVDAKSSATGNTARVVGSYNGSTYIYGQLTFNGSSSTWKIFDSAGTQYGQTATITTSVDTYYTLKICWTGTRVNALLSITSSTDCLAHIPASYMGTGTKAGFGGSRSSGTLTFDNFAFSHGPGETISSVVCDDCTFGTNMNTAECSCSMCNPVWAEELDVEITAPTGGNIGPPFCTNCPSYAGIYRVTKVPDSFAVCGVVNCCAWQLNFAGGCAGGGIQEKVVVTLTQVGSNYLARVQFVIGSHGANSALFDKTYVAAKPDCSSWSAENIPFTGQGGAYDCNLSGATVTLTAVNV